MRPSDGHVYTGPNRGDGVCILCHHVYDEHPESPNYQGGAS